jgi:hypothetical protein
MASLSEVEGPGLLATPISPHKGDKGQREDDFYYTLNMRHFVNT